MIDTVLLIPAEGDPLGLLSEGVCGARPPTVERVRDDAEYGCSRWCFSGRTNFSAMKQKFGADYQRALVLAWDGKPVEEGLDRLGRTPNVTRVWALNVVFFALGVLTDDVDGLAEHGLPGTLMLLNAEGREVYCE
jgi:hypothetical protein